ncbi:MAG: glycosyltransferase, partial [Myxococcota bacterium]
LGARRGAPEIAELLFVGRCGDPNKGFEVLLDALARLPDRVQLRVLDSYPFETRLGRRIRELEIGHRIRFDGKVSRSRLEAAYRRAAVVVVPSLFEGFGLPAIEGLAAGTPVVAARAGALPEVLEVAGAGRLVSTRDPRALTQGISEVLASWGAEEERTRKARRRIEEAFSWERVAERTETAYRAILSAAGR